MRTRGNRRSGDEFGEVAHLPDQLLRRLAEVDGMAQDLDAGLLDNVPRG